MDDDYDEDEEARDAARMMSSEAAHQRGIEDRAFYDDLAKKEDERHNAMKKDIAHRLLMLGELRQKLRHKEAALRLIRDEIADDQNRIDFETKKAYRKQALSTPDVSGVETTAPIPILTRDIAQSATGNEEFSVERAQVHIKQKEAEYTLQQADADAFKKTIDEEARVLSELQHKLVRM